MKAQHQIISFIIVLLLVLGTIKTMSEFFFEKTPVIEKSKLEQKADAIASGLLASAQFARGLELNQTGFSCDDPDMPLELTSECPGVLWINRSKPEGPVANPTPTMYGEVSK